MKTSREILMKAGIIPKLKLAVQVTSDDGKTSVKGTGPHRVKIIEDKIVNAIDKKSGKPIHAVRYTFEEDGEKKRYDVPMKTESGEIHYLVQHLSEILEGEELILEYKRKGLKGYIEVISINKPVTTEIHDNGEDDAGFEEAIDEEERKESPMETAKGIANKVYEEEVKDIPF